jgi:broad specificity phosphatase PhoE
VADLLLIRHGQARYGEADYDRLSDRGHEQARLLAPELIKRAPAAVFTGPLRRQVETYATAREAARALGHELPEPTIVAGLSEYPAFELLQHLMPRLIAEEPRFASLERAEAKVRELAFQTMIFRWGSGAWNAPGVETSAEFASRVRGGLDEIIASVATGVATAGSAGATTAGRNRTVAAFTSAGPIAVAMGLALGVNEERMIHLSRVVLNASISQLRFRSQGFAWQLPHVSMFSFNQTSHLTPELVTER